MKLSCVPILGRSVLTPLSIPHVSGYLSDLICTLRNAHSTGFVLTPSLVAYTFFPLSTILQRNASATIPDQILEKIFVVLGILWESWWWDCDVNVWDQTFRLCSAVIGGIEEKTSGKSRDDETKTAAAECLLSLLRERTAGEGSPLFSGHSARLAIFQAHIQTAGSIPILGETVNSLLTHSVRWNLGAMGYERLWVSRGCS